MAKKRSEPKELKLADAARILQTVDKSVLLRTVLEWAKDDKVLRERLVLFAARQTDGESRVAAVRRAVEKALQTRDEMSSREMRAWAKGAAEAIGHIDELLEAGNGTAVIELCELALVILAGELHVTDDSDGHFPPLMESLEDLHLIACQEIRPNPVQLAECLFRFELGGKAFYNAFERYAEVLGDEGLLAYRRLAEAEWQKVPVRTSWESDSRKYLRITSIMMTLAGGDIDQVVAVMSKDLSAGYSYLQICEVYQRAGRHDDALAWAERGLKAFPKGADDRLRVFAAEEYHRRGRHGEAMQMVWAVFVKHQNLANYQVLRKHAERASAWAEWRERALDAIRRRLDGDRDGPKPLLRPSWFREERSLLVEIFLDEALPEEAWREAKEGGCSDRLWLRLALLREKEHPEDAAPIYWKYGAAAVAAVSNGHYEDAVKLLVRAAAVMKRLGRSAVFNRDLEILRAQYRAKRNFMQEIENRRAELYLS